MPLMDVQAPAVVAVVVTTDPGPWFEETLTSLARQDYEELSVLVLATGGGEDPSERVGRILPNAFVRQLPGDLGYGAAANTALDMVEGAAFFLLCHHDCALDDDVVHNMVEESFRSNAGVVSPKFVNWDDPSILLHVGMSCDKTGAVVDRIQDGEVDHGQHDAVRDVFVAPGACMLIRADLWRELGGFDAGIVAMGEDLDLSWRSQVAGSRVVVAPDARVRHREVVASGSEPLAASVAEGDHPVTLQALQRRHELRAVLKCYGRFHLFRVLPQAGLLAVCEVVVALLARDGLRARAVAGAWTWNAKHWGEVRALRVELKARRLFPDSEVRRLQLRGSARLSRYFSRLSHQGLAAANAVVASRQGASAPQAQPEVAVLTGSVGLAFSEDADFDDLDDLGHRSGRDRFGRKVRRDPLTSGRSHTVAIVVAAIVVLLGTRELLFGTLPLVGQLAPLPGWAGSWHHFFSGWQPAGRGNDRSRHPGLWPGRPGGHGAPRVHGAGAADPDPRLYPAGGHRLLPADAPPRLGSGSSRRHHLLPGASPALRRPGQRTLGRLGGLRHAAVHRGPPRSCGRGGSLRPGDRDGVGARPRWARSPCWVPSSPSPRRSPRPCCP